MQKQTEHQNSKFSVKKTNSNSLEYQLSAINDFLSLQVRYDPWTSYESFNDKKSIVKFLIPIDLVS